MQYFGGIVLIIAGIAIGVFFEKYDFLIGACVGLALFLVGSFLYKKFRK